MTRARASGVPVHERSGEFEIAQQSMVVVRNGRRASTWGKPPILSLPYEFVPSQEGLIFVSALAIGASLRSQAIDFRPAHVIPRPGESPVPRTALRVQRPHKIV